MIQGSCSTVRRIWTDIRNICFHLYMRTTTLRGIWLPPVIIYKKICFLGIAFYQHCRGHKTGAGVTNYMNSHFEVATPHINKSPEMKKSR